MTEIMKKRIAITLYRMYDTMLSLDKHIYFFGDYKDYMSYRQNEYVKKYLRSEGCITKFAECRAVDNLSAVWEVNTKVLLKLLDQFKEYTKDIDETVKQARDSFKVSIDSDVKSKRKHISLAPHLVTSKLRRRFYINNLNELNDEVNKRFPWFKDAQSKLEYINDRNKQIGLPAFYMRVKAKKLSKDGLLSSVAIRCANQLVAMKANNGATERKEYCARKHLDYEFDVTSSIYTTTYLLNNRKLPDGDLYEMIYKAAFPKGKWDSEIRARVKSFMMRMHFDTTAKAAYFHYSRHKKMSRTEQGQKVFTGLFNGLREICGQTYDNEIFFHESCIMINTMYELMQRHEDLHIFQVYDGIYFDKPVEAEAAAVWRQKAIEYEASFHDIIIRSGNSESTRAPVTISNHSKLAVSQTTELLCTTVSNCIYIDKQTGLFSETYNNIVKRMAEDTNLRLVYRCKGISLDEYNRRMSVADNLKGIAHDSTNMKGIAHKSNGQGNRKPKNNHYIDELKEYELVNITDGNEFRAKAYAAGLNKSKVSRLWKYKVNNNL